MVAPFLEREREDRVVVADLHQRIAGARRTIKEIQALEQDANRARSEMARLLHDYPAGSALVWFPEQMKEYFGRFGITGAVTRLNTALDDTELPGFERTYWAVELPVGNASKEVRKVCLAIAEIEPLESSVRVLDVAIRPDADDFTRRLAVINVAVLSPKANASR